MEKMKITQWFCPTCAFGATVQYSRPPLSLPSWRARLTVRDLYILTVKTRYHDDMIEKIEEWHDGCAGRMVTL